MTTDRPDFDELPELPPIDGDTADGPSVDQDADLDATEDTSLDNDASDEHSFDEIEAFDETSDDGEPADDVTSADELSVEDDGARWSGDEEVERGEADDLDDLSDLAPDDLGAEGPTEDPSEGLGELPPIDDDGDDTTMEEDLRDLASITG